MIRKILTGTLLALATAAAVAGGQVNLNQANAEQLSNALSGVGTVRAQAIVDYRKSHGDFDSVAALTDVDGIGSATLAKNRDRLTVGSDD